MQVFKVENWMNKNVITISKENPTVDAAVLMKKHNIGCLIVIENDEPLGIITERDLVRKLLALHKDPNYTKVEDVMTYHIISVSLGMDIKGVSDVMVRNNIKKVPVVDNNKLRGIVTSTDIVRIMAQFNKLYDAKEIIELSGK